MTDGDSMTINNLRDSENGTFVTLDDYLLLTGYEPNAMELTEISPVAVSELVDDRTGEPVENQANQIPKTNKKETTIERRNPCDDSEIPEWLQEFRENLVDDEIPLQGGSHASSSNEASLEPYP